jgi:signal transduction histidine kinase/ActR/RegA family two-component response regulator
VEPREQTPSIVVYCVDASSFERVSTVALGRLVGGYRIEVFGDEARGSVTTVLHARARHGGQPLGMVTADEAHALMAIEAGADEATPKDALDDTNIVGFFDRVLLRARLRKEEERLRGDFVQQEKLAALGTLVAGVAHEINNPLTALLLSAERLEMCVESKASKDLTSEVTSSAQAIASVVRDLTTFARQEDDEAASLVDITVLLGQVVRMVGGRVRAHASVELDTPLEPAVVMASSSRLTQVFMNLLLNAAHAVAEVPRAAHRIRVSVRADEHAVAVSFSDTGPGVAPELLEKVFDPFFTTKRAGAGTGLGLSISRAILKRLGGDLLLESVHGEGATFVALIPAADPLSVVGRESIRSGGSTRSKDVRRRILIVDADERLLRALARGLELDYDLLLARDAAEALTLLDSGSQVDAIVVDGSLPERSGVELRGTLRERGARVAASMVFLVNTEEAKEAFGAEERGPILTKPVTRAALLDAVVRALSANESFPPPDSP